MSKVKITKLITGFFVASLLMLQACYYQPAPLYEYEPIDDVSFWDNGQDYIVKETDDITLTVSSDRAGREEAGFYVNVYNRTESVFLLDPYDFSILYLAADTSTVIDEHLHAVNPEERLKEIDQMASQEEADFKTDKAVHFTFNIIDFIGDIASIGSRSYGEVLQDVSNDLERQELMEIREYEHGEIMEQYNQNILFWSQTVLRKTTLGPNNSADGLVFFPINPKAKFVKLIIPAKDITFEVIYKQNVIVAE